MPCSFLGGGGDAERSVNFSIDDGSAPSGWLPFKKNALGKMKIEKKGGGGLKRKWRQGNKNGGYPMTWLLCWTEAH